MTETVFAPPTLPVPPPPPAPQRHIPKIAYAISAAITAAALTATAFTLTSQAATPTSPATPTCLTQCATTPRTTTPATATPQTTAFLWASEHANEITAVLTDLNTPLPSEGSSGIVRYCTERLSNLADARTGSAYADANAPFEYTHMIDAYYQTFQACIELDIDTMTVRQDTATTALLDFQAWTHTVLP